MDEPVTVTQAFQVIPGREEEFSEWATGLLNEAAHYVEYLGGGILGAGGTGDDWHVVFRWSSQEAARRWEASPVRSRFAATAASFAQADKTKRTTGVRAWFDLPSRMATPPPKWKAALVTLAAVFPPVLIFNLTVIPYLGGLSVVLRTLTLCVAVTGVVTWVMMPRLQRLLKNWLNPPPEAEAVDAGAPAPETGGRSGAGRRSRRGWSDGDTGDFGYGGGVGTATRDIGYGAGAAQPAWLVEVAPRGREEDPGWRDNGWRDVQPGRGPWYASQQHQRVEPEPEPEPGPRYRQRAESGAVYGSEYSTEAGPEYSPEPRGWYREQQESGSWYREEPQPEPRYRDEAEPEPRYRADPQPDERYWEQREPGRWYREREQETEILQPVRQADAYEGDDGPYYDSGNPPRYSRRRQGYPDDEEDYGEPEWQPDRRPGTGRYRR